MLISDHPSQMPKSQGKQSYKDTERAFSKTQSHQRQVSKVTKDVEIQKEEAQTQQAAKSQKAGFSVPSPAKDIEVPHSSSPKHNPSRHKLISHVQNFGDIYVDANGEEEDEEIIKVEDVELTEIYASSVENGEIDEIVPVCKCEPFVSFILFNTDS